MKFLKSITIGIFFIMLFPLVSIAQSLGLGFKLGADVSKIKGMSLNNDFKGHLMGGVQAHLRVGRLGLQAEANLTRTALSTGDNFYTVFRDFVKSTSTSGGADILLTELGIPVMLDLRLLGGLRVEVGIQYSLVINAKDKNDYLIDVNKVMTDGYMSGLLGAKLEIGKLQVGGRYLQGFDNMNQTPVNESWKNGRYQLYVAYLLWK